MFGRRACLQLLRRRSFSTTPAGEEAVARQRTELLDSALKHVGALGWTDESLSTAARELGLSVAAVGLLPRGPAELVEHFSAACDRRLVAELEQRREEAAELRLRRRLALALRLRLEMHGEHIASWPQALGLQALPGNAPSALRQRAALADEMWSFAGDTSSDSTWYARRIALAAVYAATEVHMVTDLSPSFRETWAFCESALDGLLELERRGEEASQLISTLLASPPERRDSRV
jgi:ubiquinone biosynthesis protein COQ9